MTQQASAATTVMTGHGTFGNRSVRGAELCRRYVSPGCGNRSDRLAWLREGKSGLGAARSRPNLGCSRHGGHRTHPSQQKAAAGNPQESACCGVCPTWTEAGKGSFREKEPGQHSHRPPFQAIASLRRTRFSASYPEISGASSTGTPALPVTIRIPK
jgi:hypothetical protein